MTTVFVNGHENSGTNATMKACHLLGVQATTNHVAFGNDLPAAIHQVFVRRDPRNVLLTTVRKRGRPMTQGMIILTMPEVLDSLRRFTGWLACSDLLQIQYEKLVVDDAEMRRLACHLQVEYLEDAFSNLPGHTGSWNLPHSNWHTVWSKPVAEAWQKIGGNDALKEWGYG